jgi:hypothetical protein
MGACDVGVPSSEAAVGPDLHVVASLPSDGDGLGCSAGLDPECGVPINTPLEFRFDRHLLPSTAVRQSIAIQSGNDAEIDLLEPHYDLVERVLRYTLPGLREAARYSVHLPVPDEHQYGFGFRAFDQAGLSRTGSAPLAFSFRTQASNQPPPSSVEPIPTCREALAVFRRGGCSTGLCHGSDGSCPDPCLPSMGLDLGSREGLIATALGRVARQTDTEGHSGVTLDNPSQFGVGMPILDRGRPDNSYLLYKLLIHPAAYGPDPCGPSDHQVELHDQCLAPSHEEIERLRNWFVRGEPMPRVGGFSLKLEDLRQLERWIAGGTRTGDCE